MKRMNRTIGMMCLAALLAVGATSCKKNNTEKTASFTFELPALEGNPFADDERGYVDITDGNQLKWWEGDQMMVYSVDATNTTPETAVYTAASGCQGTQVATFSGDMLDKGSYGYFAFYPAERLVKLPRVTELISMFQIHKITMPLFSSRVHTLAEPTWIPRALCWLRVLVR